MTMHRKHRTDDTEQLNVKTLKRLGVLNSAGTESVMQWFTGDRLVLSASLLVSE